MEEKTGLMYVGLDVHKKTCYGTVMTHDGEMMKRGRVSIMNTFRRSIV